MAKKDESAKSPPKKAQPDLPLEPEGEPALEKQPDPEWFAGEMEMEPRPGDDGPLTTGDFHNVAQKQILNSLPILSMFRPF